MKALVCTSFGLPDTLELKEIPSPHIIDDQVLIQVAACSVNFPDTLIIRNLYQFKPELPFSPGGEVSGIVKEAGKNVKHLKPGQRVFALCGWGGFAGEVAVDAQKVFPMLPGMDFVTAASVMYNYATSYHALKDRAELKAGETLLVLGAGGGVGLAAVELGKLMGANVIAAASSEEKLEICRQKGASQTINYSTEDLKDKIKELTGGRGADVIYDPVGDKYTESALRGIAWGGRYLVVGFAAGEIPKIPLNLALLKGCAITGVFWGQFAAKEPAKNFSNIQELAGFFMNGSLKPHIYQLYPLEKAKEALNDLMNRKVIGKAVVILDEQLVNEPLTEIRPQAKPETKAVSEPGTKKVFRDFDEVKAFVGQSFGTSSWVEVSQEMINEFAETTMDKQWIHLDPDKAKMTPFGQTIAHGLLTLSLTPKFMYELYEIESSKMGINYGSDKVRFLSPVLSDTRIRMSAKLKSVSDMPNNGLKMIVEATIEMEGKERPACVAELISVVY